MNKKPKDFDAQVAEIQTILARIQEGQLGLEDLRREVARALELIRDCRTRLREVREDLDLQLSQT